MQDTEKQSWTEIGASSLLANFHSTSAMQSLQKVKEIVVLPTGELCELQCQPSSKRCSLVQQSHDYYGGNLTAPWLDWRPVSQEEIRA